MSLALVLRGLRVALLLCAACSSALSPYADDDSAQDSHGADRAPVARAPATQPGMAPPASTLSPVQPIPTGSTPVAPSHSATRSQQAPWFTLDLPAPTCSIRGLAADCPAPDYVLRNQGDDLPCRGDQVGQRCPYPSEDGEANLLLCTAVAEGSAGAHWQFRRERCRRNCFGEIPHSFAELSSLHCMERPLYPCDGAGTDQTAVDDALKKIAQDCGAPSRLVFGLLLSDEGCGRALFIEDTGRIAKCASDEVMRWRFACAPRCASTKEAGDTIIESARN